MLGHRENESQFSFSAVNTLPQKSVFKIKEVLPSSAAPTPVHFHGSGCLRQLVSCILSTSQYVMGKNVFLQPFLMNRSLQGSCSRLSKVSLVPVALSTSESRHLWSKGSDWMKTHFGFHLNAFLQIKIVSYIPTVHRVIKVHER